MAAPIELTEWANFYVIVGSSAGALTGLQFILIALLAETQARGSMHEIRAFGTPTIVHFCFVLLVSAIASAPWHALSSAAICMGACGAAGAAYVVKVISHTKRQTGYKPDAGDWFWYTWLPMIAYATLFAAGILVAWHPAGSLFVVSAAALALLFDAIHNAWDSVTYIALVHGEEEKGKQ